MTVGTNILTANLISGDASGSLTSVEDPSALVVSALIILIGGLVGGYAAFLTEAEDPAATGSANKRRLRFLMLGIVAAACVPLFLSLVRSQIMSAILGRDSPNRLESYLVFSGLCLIAAYSARSFITSISQRVLQQIQEVREETRQTSEKVDDLSQVVASEVEGADALEQASLPPELVADSSLETNEGEGPAALSPQERRVLQALASKTYRTRTGVAEDSGVAVKRISEILEDLAARKLALQTKSTRTGGQRWAISKRGERALKG